MMNENANGIIIETNQDNLKAMIWGWGVVLIVAGLIVIGVTVAAQVGLAVTFIGAGLGTGLAVTGVGEGVRRALMGKALADEARAQIYEGKARMIAARQPYRIE